MKPENDIWDDLRRLTAARIGLRRTGAALATRDMLDFQFAHAQARDAVQAPLDAAKLAADLSGFGLPVVSIASAAADRQAYLMRPDLGRRPDAGAEAILAAHRGDYDVAFVVADGLSALAVHRHAEPLLARAIESLRAQAWKIAPLVIVRRGRVAIGDAIAAVLSAKCVAVLIGERPGLSAPDSMGVYLTWQSNAQTSDAERNCISNIRPDGVGYDIAAFRLTHLLGAMRTRGFSGVALKDDSDRLSLGDPAKSSP
jgi:ethanolamine ammonia-lyase small subunit